MFTALLYSFVPQLIIVCNAKQITWHLRNQIKRKRANMSLEIYTSYDIFSVPFSSFSFNRFIRIWVVQISYYEYTFAISFTAFFVVHYHLLAENNKRKRKNKPNWKLITKMVYIHILHFSLVKCLHCDCIKDCIVNCLLNNEYHFSVWTNWNTSFLQRRTISTYNNSNQLNFPLISIELCTI